MTDEREPRTPSEAWATIRQALNVAKRGVDDDHHARVVVRDINEMGGVTAVIALARLEALEPQALSDADHAAACAALDAHDPSGNGPSAWTMLRDAGFAIVRARP